MPDNLRTLMPTLSFKVKVILEFFSGFASCFAKIIDQKALSDDATTYIHQIVEIGGVPYETTVLAAEVGYLYSCAHLYPIVKVDKEKLTITIYSVSAYTGKHIVSTLEYERM